MLARQHAALGRLSLMNELPNAGKVNCASNLERLRELKKKSCCLTVSFSRVATACRLLLFVQDSDAPSGYFDALLCGSEGYSTASWKPALPNLHSLTTTYAGPAEEQFHGILLLLNICTGGWRRQTILKSYQDAAPHPLMSACEPGQHLGDVLHLTCIFARTQARTLGL